MENKINIAKILKSYPRGMELDCTIWNGVTFEGIDSSSPSYPIKIRIKGDKTTVTEYLTKFGEWNTNENSKCVIYPKGKTTWEGFVSPHKYQNGDIVITTLGSTAIIKEPVCNTEYYAHCVWVCGKLITDDTVGAIRFATESEKAELFQAIKDNGYRWNAKNKALEKLTIEPKFKAGDKIVEKNGVYAPILIANVDNGFYYFNTESSVGIIPILDQDKYELVPGKFDTTTLVPFESKMLVRSADGDLWKPAVYGFFSYKGMYVVGGIFWTQYIPYEGNQHLLGTNNDCNEYFKIWK